MIHVHRMPFGADVDGSSTRFRLWAPGASAVDVEVAQRESRRTRTLERGDEGWFETRLDDCGAGARYRFRVDGGQAVPDPASRFNPDGVHEASEVVDPAAYHWQQTAWRGRRWEEAIVYELHVGTFTPEGTFAALEQRLDDLVALGVTAVELMPLAAFAGARGWGYDGVLPFAPHAAYGRPEALKRLVDAAHARGLMMLLDVVYNHFGPEGNYLYVYASQFFNPRHQTPWGAAINFDGEHNHTVRDFFIENALYWLDEYRFDGLRLDAVHAIADDTRPDIVDELARSVRARLAEDRHIHLVLENDRNESSRLARTRDGRPTLATAQWNDDLHHALHVLVTGEKDGYYADYADEPLAAFGRALAEGFVYQGEPSPYRDGECRGEPSRQLPPTAFVSFAQNHDQVGNRAFGDRITGLAPAPVLKVAIAAMLLAPAVPMLFMGEEYAASTPFLYFADFGGDLGDAVTQGRRAEFGRFERFGGTAAERIPDPIATSTFEASKLDWSERDAGEHAEWLAFYRACLVARRRHIVPLLARIRTGGSFRTGNDHALHVEWPIEGGGVLRLVANFEDRAHAGAVPDGRILYAGPDHAARMHVGTTLAPCSLVVVETPVTQ